MLDSFFSTSALLLLSSLSLVSALNVVPSSGCREACGGTPDRTTSDEIVCLDKDFSSTTNGTTFRSCVECELGSTAADSETGATDVTWGLYNIRYAISNCVFGVPNEKVSISTPCQVSCDPLKKAITNELTETSNATSASLSFCDVDGFKDNTVVINRCAACYGRMDDESFIANFLQSLHIACLDPPRPSVSFPIPGGSIFSKDPIPTPTPTASAKASSGKPTNLPLIIALPVVFTFLIAVGVTICCFYSARHRRRIMAKRNNMSRVHEKVAPENAPENLDPEYIGQAQSPVLTSPESVYYSPDRKMNPYATEIEKPSPQQQYQTPDSTTHLSPSAQPAFPFRAYTPSDYAPMSATNPRSPIDTSTIGPGPNQLKDHALHDAFFPPPPPRVSPATLSSFDRFQSFQSLNIPQPEGYGIPRGGSVKRLDPHHRAAPSIAIPVPRKKSLEAHRAELEMQRAEQDGFQQESLNGQDRRDEKGGPSDQVAESPTVFYYDAMSGKYMKETSPR